MKEERYRETEPLKKGELVVMHTCIEARNPKYEGKIWTCKTDQFTRGEGVYAQDSIFLEGFTGSFAPEFLQRVNVEPLLTEKDATIKELQYEVKKWREQAEAKILFVANGKEGQMYALQEDNMEMWEALQWTLSALTRVTAGEPVFNLDEVIANATRTLQEQEHHAALGEGDKT